MIKLNITRGPTLSSSDKINGTILNARYAVVQGSTKFEQDIDYMLVDSSIIEWLDSGGAEPAPGSTYQLIIE